MKFLVPRNRLADLKEQRSKQIMWGEPQRPWR
jgi:hypothetical protein